MNESEYAMKNVISALCLLLTIVLLTLPSHAATVVEEFDRITGSVSKLELGFGEYILGNKLTKAQKEIAQKNNIEKALKGTYKFKDDDTFVVATNDGDIVIGVYKNYEETTVDTLKGVVGSLMLQHGEPTAMAHNKMVYWTYDKDGKIDQDVFDLGRGSGGVQSLVTVKFSSTEPIIDDKQEETKEKKISAYVMITSDPLSKLFVVQNK